MLITGKDVLFTNSPLSVLFYPQRKKEWEDPVLFEIQEYDVTILIIALPLGGMDWQEIDEQIEQATNKIKVWLNENI